jgi:hypothetical protein
VRGGVGRQKARGALAVPWAGRGACTSRERARAGSARRGKSAHALWLCAVYS